MNKVKTFFSNYVFFLIGYPLGVLTTVIVEKFRKAGKIQVINPKNVELAHNQRDALNGGMLIVSNHPKWPEVFVLPALVSFPRLISDPMHDYPWCTPKSTLYFLFPLIYFMRAITVPRIKKSRVRSFMTQTAHALHVLRNIVMMCPEGGRTNSKPGEIIDHPTKKMRFLKDGYWEILNNPIFCKSADASKVTVLPAYVEFNDGVMTVTFGTPAPGSEFPVKKLQEVLLEL